MTDEKKSTKRIPMSTFRKKETPINQSNSGENQNDGETMNDERRDKKLHGFCMTVMVIMALILSSADNRTDYKNKNRSEKKQHNSNNSDNNNHGNYYDDDIFM